jgi:hypothetical protein
MWVFCLYHLLHSVLSAPPATQCLVCTTCYIVSCLYHLIHSVLSVQPAIQCLVSTTCYTRFIYNLFQNKAVGCRQFVYVVDSSSMCLGKNQHLSTFYKIHSATLKLFHTAKRTVQPVLQAVSCRTVCFRCQ